MNALTHMACWLLAGTLSAGAAAADAPTPSDFAWRATLSVPAGASAARVTLPAEAMLRLQSPDARDVRVFNADGEALAFSVVRPAGSTNGAAAQTRPYPALPLFTSVSGKRPAKGSVQVHVDPSNQQGSVWVNFGDTRNAVSPPETATQRMPSALFDTREDKQTITALTLQADFPVNTLVHFSLASSTDLAHWTPVSVKGPLFRFDGQGAPSNHTLVLHGALPLEGRYLRLSWDGQADVHVQDMVGSIATTWTPPPRVRAPLAPGIPDGNTSLSWSLGFAAPLAALHLSTTRDNTLVPVRILGRHDAAQAWRPLAQTVVYRLGPAGYEDNNAAVALGGASVRWLRVEATSGMVLPTADIQATVEFEPIQLVFLATGKAPFELVAGRAGGTAAAIDSSVLASVMTAKLDDLPNASIASVRLQPVSATDSTLARWLPAGTEQRSVMLWAVLLLGVLVLGGVAYTLLRQLSAKPSSAHAGDGQGVDTPNTDPRS
ncbi:DUF3999 family protein [Rhodoferax sp.]|uniref:DUF3999 family protein n=1 Tax=Rhodoferax sp. TaxID=50421 RepID=UPI0027612DFD|nr:DUF3999 family protein [Rhodoferax sp.]